MDSVHSDDAVGLKFAENFLDCAEPALKPERWMGLNSQLAALRASARSLAKQLFFLKRLSVGGRARAQENGEHGSAGSAYAHFAQEAKCCREGGPGAEGSSVFWKRQERRAYRLLIFHGVRLLPELLQNI